MKNSLSYLLALGTVALTACSSMDVSSSEALEDNFPSDFVAAEYMNLHPGLRSLQIQDYVKKNTAPYKYPRIIEFVDELPKTISGKIRRVEIRNKDKGTVHSS